MSATSAQNENVTTLRRVTMHQVVTQETPLSQSLSSLSPLSLLLVKSLQERLQLGFLEMTCVTSDSCDTGDKPPRGKWPLKRDLPDDYFTIPDLRCVGFESHSLLSRCMSNCLLDCSRRIPGRKLINLFGLNPPVVVFDQIIELIRHKISHNLLVASCSKPGIPFWAFQAAVVTPQWCQGRSESLALSKRKPAPINNAQFREF
jgi:hypothetical protein